MDRAAFVQGVRHGGAVVGPSRDERVLPPPHPPGLSDRRQPHGGRRRRSRRLLLRELQVRNVAELHRLLQRGGRSPDRPAVRRARSGQAAQARLGDPAPPRGRRRPADARLAQRILHAVALREEPRAPSLALQLRAHARGQFGIAHSVGEETARLCILTAPDHGREPMLEREIGNAFALDEQRSQSRSRRVPSRHPKRASSNSSGRAAAIGCVASPSDRAAASSSRTAPAPPARCHDSHDRRRNHLAGLREKSRGSPVRMAFMLGPREARS